MNFVVIKTENFNNIMTQEKKIYSSVHKLRAPT